MTSNELSSYTTQHSNVSTDQIKSETLSLSSPNTTVHYGPIQVRLCRKPAPTIATGRRPKSLVLIGEEAIKREKRREKNREAARKLKEKRQTIEEELHQKLDKLQGEHVYLQNYLQQLQQRKQRLQEKVNDDLIDPIDELLTKDNGNINLFFEEYLDDADIFENPIYTVLDVELDPSLCSNTDN